MHHVNQLIEPDLMMCIHMTFSKKNHSTPLHSTPLHSTHSTELFKIFFSLLTLSTAFLQKASGPGKNEDFSSTTNQDSELENTASTKDIKSLLYIGNSIIPEVDEAKFLGITFDGRLSWDKHVENLYKRLKSAIAVIKRIKPCIGKENFKTLYFTLFECHILYGISVWGGIPKFRLDKIIDFQITKKVYSNILW